MRRFLKRVMQDQRGALLAEALVAVSVFTLMGSAVMTSVSATSAAAERMRTTADADSIASNQMTAVLTTPYIDPPFTYVPITPPAGYSVTAEALEFVPGDTYIAKIVVKVYKDGQFILKLESLRLKEG